MKDLGNLQQAEESTRKAIQLNPDSAKSHSNLGMILIKQGKLQEAEISLRKTIEINPNHNIAYEGLAQIFQNKGELNKSNQSYKIFLSKEIPQEKRLLSLIMIIHNEIIQGNFEDASINLREIQSIPYLYPLNKAITSEQYLLHRYLKGLNLLYADIKNIKIDFTLEEIPHIGDSHCLTFSHHTLNFVTSKQRIQPAYIVGGKAFHFSKKSKDKSIQSFFKSQIKNHIDSNKILISFGEIDCRKNEGILSYSLKYKKDMIEVCKETINGYLDFMEENLSQIFNKRYYFGTPAPTISQKNIDELDKKRLELIREYNKIIKSEVLSRGCYFVDSYKLTSKDGYNNNLYMKDEFHLHPKSLPILFEKCLCEP